MKYSLLKTKLGWTGIGTEDGAICAIALGPTKDAALRDLLERGADGPADAKRVAPLIDLVRRAAGGAPVRVNGHVRIVSGTAFQRAVWQALASIPRGQTISYAELARRVGRPGAARAVGQAVGANPVPILLPCHRVIASDGGLGGFGGGLPMKKTLLRAEGVAV